MTFFFIITGGWIILHDILGKLRHYSHASFNAWYAEGFSLLITSQLQYDISIVTEVFVICSTCCTFQRELIDYW